MTTALITHPDCLAHVNPPGHPERVERLRAILAALEAEPFANLVRVESIERDRGPYRIEHDPGHPAADAGGYVKLPNVNVLVEMADMREANRSYEANLQVIKQAREMISMTIDLLRSSS